MYNKKGEERNPVREKAASPMTRRGAGRTGRRRRERERERGRKRMKRRREEERRRGEEER